MARDEIQNQPGLLPAWLPILRQYGPALIVQCRLARQLSESLVTDWLSKYMLAKTPTKATGAEIAARLADHREFKSHSRFIDREQARSFGLVIDDLEADQALQDAVLSVFHATTHTFNATPSAKVIENHLGKCFMKIQQQQVQIPLQLLQPQQPPVPPGPPATP